MYDLPRTSGLRAFDVPVFVEKLTSRLTLDGTPDILVFNTGIHDFCGYYEPDKAYELVAHYTSKLDAALTLLRRIVGINCIINWKSTNPGIPRLQSLNELLNEAHTDCYCCTLPTARWGSSMIFR